tara:strand:- start:2138 stop:2287 length:150 start_codon:yes stop_codon:yes gene_type:complete
MQYCNFASIPLQDKCKGADKLKWAISNKKPPHGDPQGGLSWDAGSAALH